MESERLQALEALEIVGAKGTGAFFSLAEIVATVFHAPFAGISLVDHDTRWLYAGVGLGAASTPREGSCCSKVIAGLDTVVFSDLHAARAEGVLLESGFPDWRSYAGAPIAMGSNRQIGALFVADTAPRPFRDRDRILLAMLAALAVDSFRLHESLLAQQKSVLDSYLQAEKITAVNEELVRSREKIAFAAQMAKVAFWDKSLEEASVFNSGELRDFFDSDADALFTDDQDKGVFDDGGADRLRASIQKAIADDAAIDVNVPLVADSESAKRWVRITGKKSAIGEGEKRIFGCIQDVSDMMQTKNKISKIAMLDTLTGAYNRRFLPIVFSKIRNEALSTRDQLAALVIDLDNFKLVNDIHGHDTGDAVLVEVAHILRSVCRDGDIIVRLGGDEFLVLAATRNHSDGGAVLGQRLLEAAISNQTLSRFSTPVTFSIGYCNVAEDQFDVEDVLKCSDLAVFEAKRLGRNRLVRYDSTMRESNRARETLLSSVSNALAHDAFVPFFQPQLALGTGEVVGVEVLARWRRADGSIVTPGVFAEALDHPAYGGRISRTVLEGALREVDALRMRGLQVGRIAVNVTESQILDANFPNWLDQTCAANGVDLTQIEIEITERCLLTRSPQLLEANIAVLRERGVAFAFDDFGTGFASLTHLLTFKIDVIKIDRSFISRFMEDEAAAAIVQSIIDLGRNLKLSTVAEGVETEDQHWRLCEIGCTVGQGYYYSKPVSAQDLERFLRQSSGEKEEPARPDRSLASEIRDASGGGRQRARPPQHP